MKNHIRSDIYFIKSLPASLYEREETSLRKKGLGEISETCSFYFTTINKNNAPEREMIKLLKYFHRAVRRQTRSRQKSPAGIRGMLPR